MARRRELTNLCIQDCDKKLTLMHINLTPYSLLEDLRQVLRPQVYPKSPNCQLQINMMFTTWERDATYPVRVIFENNDMISRNEARSLFRKTIWLDAMPGDVFPSLPSNDDLNDSEKNDKPDKDKGHGPPASSSDPDPDNNTHRPSASSLSEPTSSLSKQLTQVDGHRVCNAHSLKEIDRPFTPSEEDQQWRRSGPTVRVDMMFEQIKLKLPGPPKFLLCVLLERKDSDICGPWKKNVFSEMGICCVSPTRINDQFLINVLLKINTKAHYHVLLEEIGVSHDDLQKLLHSLLYRGVLTASCGADSGVNVAQLLSLLPLRWVSGGAAHKVG